MNNDKLWQFLGGHGVDKNLKAECFLQFLSSYSRNLLQSESSRFQSGISILSIIQQRWCHVL